MQKSKNEYQETAVLKYSHERETGTEHVYEHISKGKILIQTSSFLQLGYYQGNYRHPPVREILHYEGDNKRTAL